MTATPEESPELRFRVLGPVEYAGGVAGSGLGGRRQRSVLAMLIARAGEVITADSLVEAVWGEAAPGRPLSSIQTYVSSLRRVIAEPIRYTGVGYRLEAPAHVVDSVVFERLLGAAKTELERDPTVATDLLDEALSLWRGGAFEDVADTPGIRLEAGRLDALRVDALEARMRAGLACGRTTGLAARMEQWLASQVLRESFVALFVSVLAAEERQAEALRVLDTTRTTLLEELGVSLGPSLQELEDRLLHQDPDVVGIRSDLGAPRRRHNLPSEGSSFHGRRDDVARVVESLSGTRLVTLVGPGGTGKTRTATEAGLEMVDTMADGVWFVDLASSDSPSDVWRELAATLPLSIVDSPQPPRNVVLEDLKARQAAIILDNCEHVIDAAAAVVSELYAAAPAVRVLATSRIPLHLRAEMVIRLQPLPTPPRDAHADEAAHSPSVELFTHRAHAAGHAEFTPEDVVVVGEICRRLDGLPLAIELTAAMTSVLTPTQILERLASNSTDVVNQDRDRPQRHASLTDTVMWSYELLTDVEQQVFVRLAIFAGGFEFADAVDVCADQHISKPAVSDALARLIDASLVIAVRRDTTNRYTMLETIRSLAARLLADTPSLDDLSRRHAEQFLALAEQWYDRLGHREETDWRRLLESNRPNLRQAFEWWLLHDAERAQLLAGSLIGFWQQGNLLPEAVETLQAALDASTTRSAGRLRAHLALASCVIDEDPKVATEMLLEVVEDAEHLGLQRELWFARWHLGIAAMKADDRDRAQAAFEETNQWAARVGEHWCAVSCCTQLAYLSLIPEEFEMARSLVSEAFAAAERLGSPLAIAFCLETQGWVELAAGRPDDAHRAFADALRVDDELGPSLELPVRLGMAAVAFAAGDLPATVRHTQNAVSHLEETEVFQSSHVDYLLQIAACIHSSSGDLDRAAALKGLISRQTVWSRRGPISGWIAAIDETAGAMTIEYPTRLDQLRGILALDKAVESD